MEGCKGLFLLILGVCLVTGYVDSVEVFGDDPNNPYEDVTFQLEKHRAEKDKLEKQLVAAGDAKQRDRIQKDLDKVISAIGKMEVHFRVVYRDHLDAIAMKTSHFENEKRDMKKQLKDAEMKHAEVVAKMEATNKKDRQQIDTYQKELEKLAVEKDRIEKELIALKELHFQRQNSFEEEKEELNKMKDDLTRRMEKAVKLKSEALNATIASSPGCTYIPLPDENEFEKIKDTATKLAWGKKSQNMDDYFKVIKELRSLYGKLCEESKLSNGTPLKEMETELTNMRLRTTYHREKVIKERNALLKKLSQKELADYEDEEIEALQTFNHDVSISDQFLEEIARRSTYTRAIRKVVDLETTLSRFLGIN